ncbi:MAG: SET domain-containing protein-lysine N-methyltransferase [Bacteroidia bacterium]|nr:SET domain-containing protein-lysine N-methyltransferase [Bacteroidia bacterium]
MAWFEKYLYVKKSGLKRAGKGLFTKKAIPKGKCLTEYKGRIRTWKESLKEPGDNQYFFYVNAKTVINPLHGKNTLAHFANDADGFTRSKAHKNNAEYLTEGKRCFIYSTRPIARFEEILVDYGWEYWKVRKEIMRDKKPKKRKKKTQLAIFLSSRID